MTDQTKGLYPLIPPPPAVVRRATMLAGKAWAVIFFVLGVLVGAGLMAGLYSYQTHVTRELVSAWGKRMNAIEDQLQHDKPVSFKTSKAQAAVIAAKKEKEYAIREMVYDK